MGSQLHDAPTPGSAMVTKPAFKIRRAASGDLAAIADIGSRVFSATFGHSVTEQQLQNYLDEAYSQAAIAAEFADPNKTIIVATAPGDATESARVVGFAQLTQGSTEPCVEALPAVIELQRLYVDSAFHGKGVGKVLMQEAERIARDMGFINMWLGVWEENHKAQAVYSKLGFKKVGKHDFDVGGDIQTDEILVKALA
ncbi:protease synthase and sporulation negative regulatory protein PAI 1 [Purpureocillium lilacinum]|uniref:Protease synthase and sporulation negative regulatory protein PAI 1 n=1 Tax=Purpureocillium lilacinum TaxID=33203 RepID=A0A179HEX1_PURLI|nr:protease synthase and sporulation negative regulatory protein PAI 1 [Purpureocillium lilacinum]OAQ88805.1 protease synthase and sporulation negative regulatory protein PAI 1 [Purpureocillium lilacinum]